MSQNLAAIPCFILCKMILSEKLDFILSVSHNTKHWINGPLMVTKMWYRPTRGHSNPVYDDISKSWLFIKQYVIGQWEYA
jgi:hypothetical protein